MRLFYSETAAINTADYMTETGKLYKSLFFENLPLGFATKNIIEKQDNSSWKTILVYKTNYVTDDEFDALQAFLNNGGTVLIDTVESLSLNEYGKERKQKLSVGKGQLKVLNTTEVESLKKAALASVTDQMPALQIAADNGEDFKTTITRIVTQEDGSYLVNLLNVGHTSTKINLQLASGEAITVTDLMTGNAMDTQFELPSEGVLLLEVKKK